MKMSVYLPDHLHERVKAADGLNVSAVLQQALEAELERREHLDKLDEGMGEIELVVERVGNQSYDAARTVVFNATPVPTDVGEAYITEQGRIAVHDAPSAALWVYNDLDELEADLEGNNELLVDVAEALGESRPIRLDI